MKTTEYLSQDILEDSFLRSFYPFRLLQIIFGTCRVDARGKFVTAPTILQKIYSVINLLFFFVFNICFLFYYLSKYSEITHVYCIALLSICLHYGEYLGTVVNARFFKNDVNVKFIVQMQKIDRKLKIDKNTYFNDITFKANAATVLVTLLLLLSIWTTSFFCMDFFEVTFFSGFLWTQMTCLVEGLFCSNIFMFFYLRLRYVNAIITNYLEGTENIQINSTDEKALPTTHLLRHIASTNHNFEFCNTDVYLTDLFEEFITYQNLHRFQILLLCVKFVSGVLLYFEYELLTLQKNIFFLAEAVVFVILSLAELSVIVFICVRCEVLSREINKTKYLCITVLSVNIDGPLRKKAINMLKLIKEKPPRISIYDMWYMDASTMLKIFNLVTSFMVTLLQFTLL